MPQKSKLTHEEFTLKAIQALRKDGYKGTHIVFSGFNKKAFEEYFNTNPKEATSTLSERGIIVIVPSRKGVTIYNARDLPEYNRDFKKKVKESSLKNPILEKILKS